MLGAAVMLNKALLGTKFNIDFGAWMASLELYKTTTWANVLVNWSSLSSSQKDDACRDALTAILGANSTLLAAATMGGTPWLATKVWVN